MLALASLGACASHHGGGGVAGRGNYKIGAPYTIDGITYVPQEEFDHVETGTASWYGPGFHGKYTANGEVYDQSEHTAAHRTLQMPSVVRVTNLDTGQSTIVRINDRGPYARNRVLDVSRAAAEDLGLLRHGTAHVRIDQLHTESEAVKNIAIRGGGAGEQEATVAKFAAGRRGPPAVTATADAAPGWSSQPQTVAASNPRSPTVSQIQASGGAGGGQSVASLANAVAGSFYVQIGAFSNATNAEHLRDTITSYGTTAVSQSSLGGFYRVRVGPYTTPDAAGIVAERLKRSGYGDARVVAD